MSEFAKEVTKGDRFEFGKNWQQFLTTLDDKRVEEAEASLKQMLGVTSLDGKQFLDIGSGSGLFSLVDGWGRVLLPSTMILIRLPVLRSYENVISPKTLTGLCRKGRYWTKHFWRP